MFWCRCRIARGQSDFFLRDAAIKITKSRLVAARAAITISAIRMASACSVLCWARIVPIRPEMIVIIVSKKGGYDSPESSSASEPVHTATLPLRRGAQVRVGRGKDSVDLIVLRRTDFPGIIGQNL